MVQPSTFRTALPYAGAALTVAIAGAALSLTATSTAAIVTGIAAAFFGTYAFYGVIGCGMRYSDDSTAFQENLGSYMTAAAGFAITNIITTVAQTVLSNLLNNCLNRGRARI